MANYNPYATSSYQQTSFFPQPQGNIYVINNSMELANIPISGGLSAVICPSENLLFIKALQNGSPTVVSYLITPAEPKQNETQSDFSKEIKALKEEIASIKKEMKGGKLNEFSV